MLGVCRRCLIESWTHSLKNCDHIPDSNEHFYISRYKQNNVRKNSGNIKIPIYEMFLSCKLIFIRKISPNIKF